MPSGTALLAAALGVGLVATLVLSAYLTPRAWWRRPNARALAVLAAGTAGIGCLLAWAFAPPEPAHAAPRVAQAIFSEMPAQGRSYRVHRDLNLRAASGVGARRLAVVPAGARVTATGAREGDWWQVTAQVDGRPLRGWASSLWLRRGEEEISRDPAAPSD